MNQPYVIAVYIRLSHEDNDVMSGTKNESNSVSNQRSYIREYIQDRPEFGKADILELIDDGYSGTNFNRPGIQKLLELCRQQKINCVIVRDFSRFGRNYLESGDYLEQLFPFLGVRFISINDGYDSNEFIGKTGGLEVAFKNFISDMYSRDLSEKVKSAVGIRMKTGEYRSGWILYGYRHSRDRKNMIIDENAAAVIRRIFREAASGKPGATIAQELNDDGILTPLGYKQSVGEQLNREYSPDTQWNRQKIVRIIKEEKYKGDMIYRKHRSAGVGSRRRIQQPREDWIIVPEHHEAIVSKELFEQANANIRQAGKENQYWRGQRQAGVVNRYCNNRMLTGAGRKPDERIPAADILTEEKKKMAVELKRLEKQNMDLYEKYRMKLLDQEQFLKEKQRVTRRIQELQKNDCPVKYELM